MTMHEFETLIVTILFAAIFLFGSRLHLSATKPHKKLLSFSAGVAVAYVFVRLLPELQMASEIFTREIVQQSIFFSVYHVYLSAMFGFMLFYGLEHMVRWSRLYRKKRADKFILILHITGFAIYSWLVSYLLIRGLEDTVVPITLYAVAMGLHFLSIEHELYLQHSTAYIKYGRYIIAAAVLLGWVAGCFFQLPKPIIITLLALITGGVMINSMLMELPQEKSGKFLPFLFGGCLYSALLLFL